MLVTQEGFGNVIIKYGYLLLLLIVMYTLMVLYIIKSLLFGIQTLTYSVKRQLHVLFYPSVVQKYILLFHWKCGLHGDNNLTFNIKINCTFKMYKMRNSLLAVHGAPMLFVPFHRYSTFLLKLNAEHILVFL